MGSSRAATDSIDDFSHAISWCQPAALLIRAQRQGTTCSENSQRGEEEEGRHVNERNFHYLLIPCALPPPPPNMCSRDSRGEGEDGRVGGVLGFQAQVPESEKPAVVCGKIV